MKKNKRKEEEGNDEKKILGNNIGDEGVEMMNEGLKSNSTLTKLNLDSIEWIKKRNERL